MRIWFLAFVFVGLLVLGGLVGGHEIKVDIRDNRFFRAAVALGSPRQFIWALVDLQRSDLVVSSEISQNSKSYNSLDGYEYLVLGDSNPLYLPIGVAQGVDQSTLAVTETFMVFGLGPGSPIWKFFRCVTLTGSFLMFENQHCDCQENDVVIDCDVDQGLGVEFLCVSNLSVQLAGRVAFQETETVFFADLGVPPDVYSNLRFKSKSFQRSKTKEKLPSIEFSNGLKLSSDVYLLQTESRRIFRAGMTPNGTASVSIDALLDWQFKIDRRLGKICATKAPITLHTSVFYAFLTLCLALALPCWYFIDEPHVGAYLVRKKKNLRQSHPFGTLSAGTVIALTVVLLVDFVGRSQLWHMPLPDRWLLVVYMFLQGLGALAALAYLLRIDRKPWPGQALMVESAIWLDIWLIQTNASRGTWDLLSSSIVFWIFYIVWWQHLWIAILVLIWLQKLDDLKSRLGDPRRTTTCKSFVERASNLCANRQHLKLLVAVLFVLTGLHTYLLVRWILLPIFSALANFGYIIGTGLTSFSIAVSIYTSLFLAKKHLLDGVSLFSKSLKDVCSQA